MAPSLIDDLDETSPLIRAVSPTPALLTDPGVQEDGYVQEDQDRKNGDSVVHKKPNMAIIFPAITIGIFLAAADGTIAMVSYATISSELNALNLASWIMTAYILALASFQPLYGKLCDIFGRKECLLGAYVLFAGGCLACGFSQTIEQLIVARVLQAIGGAGLGTVVSILLTGLVSTEDRGLWQSVVNVVYSLGAGLGAPLGGLLASSVGWRWSFFGQVPICVIAILVVSLCLDGEIGRVHHPEHANTTTLLYKLRRVDLLGSASLIVMISAFLLGLDRGSNVSWTVPETYFSFIAAFVAAIWFYHVEANVAKEPILPLSDTFSRELTPIYLASTLNFFGIIALDFTLPLYYQVKNSLLPREASYLMLPAIVAGVCGSVSTGFWMRLTGQYYWAYLLACVLQTTGGLMAFLFSGAMGHSTPGLVVSQAISELGIGSSVVSGLIAVISSAPQSGGSSIAIVTATFHSFRNLGAVFGVSVISTVIQQALRDYLTVELGKVGGLDVETIVEEVRKSLEYINDLDPKVAVIVRECYGKATNKAFVVILGTAFFSIFPALAIYGGKSKKRPEVADEE